MDVHELTLEVKRKAYELGFAHVGITTPDAVDGYEDELLRRQGYDSIWDIHDQVFKLRKAARP